MTPGTGGYDSLFCYDPSYFLLDPVLPIFQPLRYFFPCFFFPPLSFLVIVKISSVSSWHFPHLFYRSVMYKNNHWFRNSSFQWILKQWLARNVVCLRVSWSDSYEFINRCTSSYCQQKIYKCYSLSSCVNLLCESHVWFTGVVVQCCAWRVWRKKRLFVSV